MRRENISVGEYYHIYNRGVNKQIIFRDDKDRIRFLFLILYFQSDISFDQISRIISKFNFVQHPMFDISRELENKIISKRFVELVSFSMMPNHFHLLVKESEEGGIGKYLQKILNSYTKYFNTRHGVSGHLFQGAYKHVYVESNEQLLYLSAYIHLNCRDLVEWRNKEVSYTWSSYQDYAKENRWGKILKNEIIIEQFEKKQGYKYFVETSGAKDFEEKLDLNHLEI